MTFVLLEPKEGIRREHVAQSFEAMVGEWGLPRMLYLDNGAEYSWADMIDGFTALSTDATFDRAVMDLESSPDVADRVRGQKQAVIRSRPYNAKGKPGIEGVFAVLEGGVFSTLQGGGRRGPHEKDPCERQGPDRVPRHGIRLPARGG